MVPGNHMGAEMAESAKKPAPNRGGRLFRKQIL